MPDPRDALPVWTSGDPTRGRQPERGLDGSALFAAERVFEPLCDALAGSQRALNLAEALRVQAVLATWARWCSTSRRAAL